MALMIPTPMLPTESRAEERLYAALRDQLPNDVAVYHGTKWVRLGAKAKEGESDFLIADPRRGLLFLEVKGGALRFDPKTRTWYQNGKLLDKDPFAQAQESMHWLVERLAAVPGWRKWKASYGYSVAFPDGDYTTEAHPGAPLALVIDRRDIESLADRVARIMDQWGAADPNAAVQGMQGLDEALGYRVEVVAPLGARFEVAERRMIELTEEQSYIRDFIRRQPRLAVTGTAGSGKTLIAIQTATWLAEHGQRTLITCFNKRLGRYIAGVTADQPNIRAVHFHELAYDVALEAGVIEAHAETPLPDNASYFTEELPRVLQEATRLTATRFDAIVVDEAQDFQDNFWPALLSLHANPDHAPLYLFGDDNQNIYEGGTLPVKPNEIFGPLRKNMRNSREIQEFLASLYRGEAPPLIDGPSVGPVRVTSYADPEDLVAKVERLLADLKRQDVRVDDIVLLTPSRTEKSSLRNRERIGKTLLSEEGAPGSLLATSLHAFKGLERPVVILPELGDRGEKRLVEYLYVGGSRARYQLYLLAVPRVAEMLSQFPGTG